LVLKEESDIKFLTETNLFANEEHRINYVAISRAKNRLFISVPAMANNEIPLLQTYFDIESV
jgi:DNA helicase II / ATP-dependent DNA helicase PcrA